MSTLREKIAAPPIAVKPPGEHLKTLFAGKRANLKDLQRIRDTRYFSLSITSKCSLMCPYCVSNMFLPETQQLETAVDALGASEYLKRVYYFAKPYLPNISFNLPGSGEPSESPHFTAIATELLKWGKSLNFQSNLHGIKNIEAFAANFTKKDMQDRVTVTISFHCGTYIDLGDRGEKMRQAWLHDWLPRLVNTGIKINTVVVPMSPPVLRDKHFIEDCEYIIKLAKCSPTLTELFHFYGGQRYPDAYTPEESERLAEIQSHFHYGQINLGLDRKVATCAGTPGKAEYLTNYIEVKGFPCASWVFGVEILADGAIRGCQAYPTEATSFGNICNPDYQKMPVFLSNNPLLCPAEQCLCRSFGVAYCLQLHGISLDEYYHAWYLDKGKPEVATHFK